MPENDQPDADTASTDQSDTSTTDQQPKQSDIEPDKGTEKDHEADAARWKAMARKHEAVAKANAAAAKRLAELEEADKTEAQKLADQLAARDVELQEFRVEKIRNEAGHAAGLTPDMWEFITASEPDAAAEQAKRLAKRLTPPDPGPANLRQGARTPAKAPASADDAFRALLGQSHSQ